MKDQLRFDTADAGTIADSDSVGAFVRSSDGTLITKTTDGAREALDVFTELSQAESSTHTSGDLGAMALGVRNDAGTALAADGEYIPLSMDATGALRVNSTVNVDSASDYAEDSAHTTGDIGEFNLSIRLDDIAGANSALLAGTEGDYQGTFTDARGALWVTLADTITINDTALANTAIANAVITLAIANTSENLVTAPLANRKYLFAYNFSNQKAYIGASGVTAATGFPVSPGSYLEMRAGAAVDIEFVGQSGKQPEMRTLELS